MSHTIPVTPAITSENDLTEKGSWDVRVNYQCYLLRVSQKILFWTTFMATIFSIFASFKTECKPTAPKYKDLLTYVDSAYATFRTNDTYGVVEKIPLSNYFREVPGITAILLLNQVILAVLARIMKMVSLGRHFSTSHPDFKILENVRVYKALKYIKCSKDIKWSLVTGRILMSTACLFLSLLALFFMQSRVFEGSYPLYLLLNPFGYDATSLIDHLSNDLLYRTSVNCTMGLPLFVPSDIIVFNCSFKCNSAFPIMFLLISTLICWIVFCHIGNIACLILFKYSSFIWVRSFEVRAARPIKNAEVDLETKELEHAILSNNNLAADQIVVLASIKKVMYSTGYLSLLKELHNL